MTISSDGFTGTGGAVAVFDLPLSVSTPVHRKKSDNTAQFESAFKKKYDSDSDI